MPASLSLLSPAKLNLFLHITGRREDGYHELQTLFQLLDWGDQMLFTVNHTGTITITGDTLGIPPEDNLIVRAARLLQKDSLGVAIKIEKHIPAGGGLGGGSSNAATTLLALNHLWNVGLSQSQLLKLGATLGADVPVFLGGRSSWAEGVGDILTPMELPQRWFLVVMPPCHVTTGEIFSHPQLTRNTFPIKMAAFFEGDTQNDCQEIVRHIYPQIDNILKVLGNFGRAKLTGTGACVFVDFDNAEQARTAQGELPDQWRSVVARGINASPVHAALA